MQIDFIFDPSVTSSPYASEIKQALYDAAAFYQANITTNAIITIDVGFGEADNQPLPGNDAADNISNGKFVNYSDFYNVLSSHSIYNGQTNVLTPLTSILPSPTSSVLPTGAQMWITNAEQKALGLLPSNNPGIDAYLGLNSSLTWNWTQQVISGSQQHDAVGAIEHEVSEIMGRVGYLGDANAFRPPISNDYGPMDLYRFSAANTPDTKPGPGYYSLDNGKTTYGSNTTTSFNNPANGGDAADWDPSIVGDSFGDNYSGVGSIVTGTDLGILQALGWNEASLPELTVTNVKSSVSTVPVYGSLTVSYDLYNVGDVGMAPTTANVYLYSSLPTTNSPTGALIGTISQPQLQAGSNVTESLQVQIPNLTPGTYYLGVIANRDTSYPETDYLTNNSSDIVPISVTAAPVPTISISSAALQSDHQTLTITGSTSDTLSPVHIFDGSTQIATTSSNFLDGNWTVNVKIASQGTHLITAEVIAPSGKGVSNTITDLVSASTSVVGGGNAISLSGRGSVVKLADTNNVADSITAWNSTVNLASASANVDGGGNTINITGGTANSVRLSDTNGKADSVNGSNSTVTLNSAQATIRGNSDTISFAGNNTVTASGNSDAFIFSPVIGKTTVSGWNSTDTMQLVKADFASWNALLSHTKQAGADTLISLDAADTITLKGVTASSLKQSQFHFA